MKDKIDNDKGMVSAKNQTIKVLFVCFWSVNLLNFIPKGEKADDPQKTSSRRK